MTHPPDPENDILPRLWHRAAKTTHPGDKALLLEAANMIGNLRKIVGYAGEDAIDPEVRYRLGIRIQHSGEPKGE